MNIHVYENTEEMGRQGAAQIAEKLRKAIARRGEARLLLSTGASQFETITALTKEDVDWRKVTMFHLDEYVELPESHKASFRRYLKERFVNLVPLKEAVFVNGEGDVKANITYLTERIKEQPIDVGVIGIGENGHIAFNDPPADFETEESYLIVNLDQRCKQQQVGEGWFATEDEVPRQAVSMSVRQIMSCRSIVSMVPHKVKAEAVVNTLSREITNLVPATILKTHEDWSLYLDADSASGFMKLS
ncbi:MAG: glucosamine-6-phosphate deaminase [Hungatella sp.]|jgi:glucosamine-6-phosphate deaminase|nr:glucosamine-6-phosphate deaminase [Hungatella sp.]